jgi:acetyl esterase/lipase
LLLAASSLPAYSLNIEGFTPDQFVEYKTVGQTSLKLHIFNPEGQSQSDKRSAIVFFYGGGFVFV